MPFHIYCIPGLGFNEAIFSKLNLAPHRMSILNWIEPLPDENIQSYASRMMRGIEEDDFSEVIVLGHSFGGVVAQEMAVQKKPALVIIVSSIRFGEENPLYFKLVNKTRLYQYFNKSFIKTAFAYLSQRHGFDSEDKKSMFNEMLSQNSDTYLQWALKTITEWEGGLSGFDFFRIHGSKDLTFDIKKQQQPYYLIEDGNHIMIYDKSTEVGEMILNRLRVLAI